jgi:hypothetical protein
MESSAHYLFENLELQLALHGELLSILEKKRRAVIERDLGGLEAALSSEENIVEEIRHLTEGRTSIMEKFAERHGILPEEIRLGKIGEYLPEQTLNAFEETLVELSESAGKIIELDTLTLPRRKAKKAKTATSPSCAQPVAVVA